MIKDLKKPLKLGFIGGGINSSIGKIHLIASQLDKNFVIETGFFSRKKNFNIKSQKQYNLDTKRVYDDVDKLLLNEKNKVDIFVILTPTPNHFQILKKLILHNVNIIIEKPILSDLTEVKRIQKYLKNYNKKIYVVHNYIGYPAIREIKQLIKIFDFVSINLSII